MFKTAFDNAQHRERRAVTEDRSNSTAFDYEKLMGDLDNERKSLIQHKVDLEAWLRGNKDGKARSIVRQSRARSPAGIDIRLSNVKRRQETIENLAQVNRRLAQIKVERESATVRDRSKLSYSDAFYRCAREVLPTDIMDRIHSAAVAVLAHNDRLID